MMVAGASDLKAQMSFAEGDRMIGFQTSNAPVASTTSLAPTLVSLHHGTAHSVDQIGSHLPGHLL